ncbi:MAG: hypothetical protein PHE41_01640 [Eubacteriales bacterium]|nr:hypothetical protein [Eubacteriales bacterium]
MDKSKFIWIPRILAIIFILFITLFSLDVFSMEGSIFLKIGAFLIHSIPSLVLAIILIISWKRPRLGGFIFIIIGIAFTIFFKTYYRLDIFLLISFPPMLVGILFFIADFLQRKRYV